VSEQYPGGWAPEPGQPSNGQLQYGQPHFGQPSYGPSSYGPQQYGQPPYPPGPPLPPSGQPPYPPVPPPSGSSRPLIIGAVVALAAIIATVVAIAGTRGDQPATAAPPAATAPIDGQGSGATDPAPVAPEPADELGTAGAPVPLGQPAPVGDYAVTVTNVILDGDAIVAQASQFNDTPAGRYVIVEVTAQYVGYTEGTPFWDLSYVFNGTDSRQYSDSDCWATLPEDASDAPTLNPSGAASFQVCMDVPPSVIDGGHLFIEPLMSWDRDERVFFAIR
jgi:hypothetical protein